jgi:uncharacterized DUF497 family protein
MGRTVYSDDSRFEWDEDKNRVNIKKHGISFDEVLEVFDDPCFLEGYDFEHSIQEERYYGIGCLNNVLIMLVFYTERGNRKRIISARQADVADEEKYNDNIKKING